MTELENRAHAQKALISSDAMRFFMNATKSEGRNEALDAILTEAKVSFIGTDGWVVINLARIETLMDDTDAEAEVELQTDTVTAGSLAESLVTGNVIAAFELIAHRPMVALADATADLDAVYRARKGEQTNTSDLLTAETARLSDEQLKAAIAALTSALDGTYDSEEAAVKTAIVKAIKAVH